MSDSYYLAFMRRWCGVVGFCLALTLPLDCLSATVTKSAISADLDLITISGKIDAEALSAFRTLALSTKAAIVSLEGPGGNLHAALQIGMIVQLMGYETAVMETECASACALIWLSGSERFMHPNARIGFHAGSAEARDGQGNALADSVANARVGAYFAKLGLSELMIEFATSAQPSEMKWLNSADVAKLGLSVKLVGETIAPKAVFNEAVRARWVHGRPSEEYIKLYRQSANSGFAGAQNNLGDIYESGDGVQKSEVAAAYWYARSAERGEPTAYLSLATFLSNTATDEAMLIEALKFAILASEQLKDGKNRSVARDAQASLRAKLPEDAQKKAAELARSWRPLYQEQYLMSDTPDK